MASASVQGSPVTAARQVRRRRRFPLYAYLFLLPYLILMIAFGLGPAIYAIGLSFTDTLSVDQKFNGIQNYITTIQDFRFWPAFLDVLLFTAIWLPVTVVGTVGLALLLHARVGRFSSSMRMIYYLPGAITGSANVVLWIFLLDPRVSPFGFLLNALGFKTIGDFVSINLGVVFAIMAFSTGAGSWIVVMFGAFQNISKDIIEAATIDGCGSWQLAFFVKLPLITKYVAYSIILGITNALQIVVEPSLFATAGFPVSPTPWSPNQLAGVYNTTYGDFGSSAAISMWLLLIGLAGSLFVIFRTNFYQTDVD